MPLFSDTGGFGLGAGVALKFLLTKGRGPFKCRPCDGEESGCAGGGMALRGFFEDEASFLSPLSDEEETAVLGGLLTEATAAGVLVTGPPLVGVG